MIGKYIGTLLFEHECVIVPGLGGFLSSYAPAYIHPVTHRFAPPYKKLAFNSDLSGNDGLLVNYYAGQKGVSFQEASLIVLEWVEKSKKTLSVGGKVVIENIGALTLNKEGNVQFEPFNSVNFLQESFGLPTFVAHPLITVKSLNSNARQTKVPSLANDHDKIRSIVSSAVKWVAVLAPFVAFSLWGISNQEIIGSLGRNYTGMFSWSKTTPGKTSTIKVKTVTTIPEDKITPSPEQYILKANPKFEPSVYAYQGLKEVSLTIEPTQNEIKKETEIQNTPGYRIILGAFQSVKNADNLIDELRVAGFPAAVLGNTRKGLTLVGIRGFKDKSEALAVQAKLKEAGFDETNLSKE